MPIFTVTVVIHKNRETIIYHGEHTWNVLWFNCQTVGPQELCTKQTLKCPFFTMSRVKTVVILGQSANKTPGAHQLIRGKLVEGFMIPSQVSNTNFKIPMCTISRAITVVIPGRTANKTPGAWHYIMSNTHWRFYDFISNTFQLHLIYKMPVFNNSRAITVVILGRAAKKSPGVHQLTQVNIYGSI